MGDKIFLNYDRDELDVQYNNRKRVADFMDYVERWQVDSEQTRQSLRCHLDVSFGSTAAETMDIFLAEAPNAPVCMFIHGGYWQSLDKRDFSVLARGLVPHGVSVVINNYGLCPTVSMDEITRQNRAALAWLWAHAGEFAIDRDRIHVSGHSAGGHLTAALMATQWSKFHPDAPRDLVKSACAISGLYDLIPIQLCYLNDVLHMDESEASRNSPVQMNFEVPTPMLITHGGLESQEYYRQTDTMTGVWEKLGYPVERVVAEGLNHFSLVDEFINPHSELTGKQLALIQ